MNQSLGRGAPDVLPASQYLQERLQERRARNTRPRRARQSDFGPRKGRDDDIFCADADERGGSRFGSSPPSARSKAGSEAGNHPGSRRRTLGVRDVDEQLDRLNKENFALKLELDHRRDATAKLQEQLDGARDQFRRAQQLEKEHAELLHINGQLVAELEKRDQAVEEAVDNINDLEDENADLKAENAALRERLETRTSTTRPSTANADSGYAGTETNEQAPPSSPPQLSMPPKTPQARPPPAAASVASHKLFSALNADSPAKTRREPLILSQRKTSTQALRSVFLEASKDLQPVKSFASLLSKRDPLAGEDEVVLDSPSLSVLSESSFPSLYSPKKHLSPDRYDWEGPDGESHSAPHSHLRQDSINRVSRWMSDADIPDDTPSKSNRLSMPVSESTIRAMSTSPVPTITGNEQFLSLDAISARPSGASPSKAEKRQLASFVRPLPFRIEMEKTRSKQSRLGGPIFGEPLLPPTPDSASTRMLRASRSSIAEDRSLLDMTPAPVKSFAALEPGVRTAPRQMRSSVELKSAYSNNLRYRQNHFSGNQNDDSSSDENGDAPTGSPNGLDVDYDGYPDGNSILMGTPSRFLKSAKGPRNAPIFFDASDISPPQLARPAVRRRQSSSGASSGPRKPSFGRTETSPTCLGSLGRLVSSASKSTMASANSGSKSSGESAYLTSPRSAHSGSSGIRTVIQPADRNSTISPGVPTQSRTPAVPASTFSQKTQKILRRLSNSQSERELPRSPHEKSPLPTLTSTPSSAYVNNIPISMRRPSTAEAARQSIHPSTTPRPPSSHRDRRPSMTGRTKTAPPARSPSHERTTEKLSFFKRSNSVKNAAAVVSSPAPAVPMPTSDKDAPGANRRRGSFRDAVTTNLSRRQWR